MIQRASVPSLLSFWDERFLDSWFDSEQASVSPGLAAVPSGAAYGHSHYHKVIASDAVMCRGSAKTGMTSTDRRFPPADLESF